MVDLFFIAISALIILARKKIDIGKIIEFIKFCIFCLSCFQDGFYLICF